MPLPESPHFAIEKPYEQSNDENRRSVTVREQGDLYAIRQLGQERSVPMIQLRGKWLREAGFMPGEKVIVIVEPGRLTIFSPEDEHPSDSDRR